MRALLVAAALIAALTLVACTPPGPAPPPAVPTHRQEIRPPSVWPAPQVTAPSSSTTTTVADGSTRWYWSELGSGGYGEIITL